jgi:hypothetical protein
MSEQIVTLNLTIQTGFGNDEEYSAKITQGLGNEILELDVEDVRWPKEDIPEGSKGGDAVTWGQLIITLAASGGVFTTLITLLQAWVSRYERHALTLEIDGDKLEITGISTEEQKRLIDEWMSRHPTILEAR